MLKCLANETLVWISEFTSKCMFVKFAPGQAGGVLPVRDLLIDWGVSIPLLHAQNIRSQCWTAHMVTIQYGLQVL